MATYCTDINIAKGRENSKNLKKKQSGLENTRKIRPSLLHFSLAM
jgi:hypothetical protein